MWFGWNWKQECLEISVTGYGDFHDHIHVFSNECWLTSQRIIHYVCKYFEHVGVRDVGLAYQVPVFNIPFRYIIFTAAWQPHGGDEEQIFNMSLFKSDRILNIP